MNTGDSHTPGPWFVEKEDGDGYWVHNGDDPQDVLEGTSFPVAQGIRSEADARLIGAAPELLEIARRMYAYFQQENPSEFPLEDWAVTAGVAEILAKAEGGK